MDTFDEHSEKAREIREELEMLLGELEFYSLINFKEPWPDIARRFLNEIKEFKPAEEVKE